MEILNNFHPIYLIFPILLTFLLLFKESKLKTTLIVVCFILIFVCAETGADYNGYKSIYNNCLEKEVHGEFLFVVLCKCFNVLEISYDVFRVVFLSCFIVLFSYSLSKLSKNFTLSFLIAYLLYVIYFVSALRQFATMAIMFYSLHLYLNKNKIVVPIAINFVAIFIHKLAFVQLAILLMLILYEKIIKKKNCIEKKLLKKWFLIILLVSLMLRVGIFVVLNTPIGLSVMSMLPYPELSILNLGLVSRIVLLICLTNLYVYSKDSKKSNLLFAIYFIGMIFYLIFPFELIMGRLINNIKMLEIILIPSWINFNCETQKEKLNLNNKNENKKSLLLQVCCIVITVAIILIFFSQLTNQVGYDIFKHMFWR